MLYKTTFNNISVISWQSTISEKTTDLSQITYEFYHIMLYRWLNELGRSLSPIQRGFASGFVNYKKGCTQLAVASGKVYQLLAHGRWFSPGTPASSTTKTGHHDIAEILLKVTLNTKFFIKSITNTIINVLYITLQMGTKKTHMISIM